MFWCPHTLGQAVYISVINNRAIEITNVSHTTNCRVYFIQHINYVSYVVSTELQVFLAEI